MSCAKLSFSHNVLIGYILASIDKRQMYTCEVFERAKLAARLNNQSVNARYNEKKRAVKINIHDVDRIDFRSVSNAQKAMSIDSFLYNSDNAPRFEKNEIVKKLRGYRETLQFDESDYNSSEWFVEYLPVKQPKSHEQFKEEYARIHCVAARW